MNILQASVKLNAAVVSNGRGQVISILNKTLCRIPSEKGRDAICRIINSLGGSCAPPDPGDPQEACPLFNPTPTLLNGVNPLTSSL